MTSADRFGFILGTGNNAIVRNLKSKMDIDIKQLQATLDGLGANGGHFGESFDGSHKKCVDLFKDKEILNEEYENRILIITDVEKDDYEYKQYITFPMCLDGAQTHISTVYL